jgi:dihydrodipicolinate synthase/N-acetylneuraminate lyase
MTSFEGVLPALITPFTTDGSAVDEAALRTVVARAVASGAGGLVSTGSTGEVTTLTAGERRRVLEVVVDEAGGRVPVVAGTTALTTADTIALSVHAERAGATAVMVMPPFYGAPAWRETVAHFAAVADRVSIPSMYYHMPSASGTSPSLEQFMELRRAANVTSLKDSSGDAVLATALIQAGDAVPTYLNGADTLTFAALAAGVRAVVWGAASFMPAEAADLHRLLVQDLDLAAGRTLWRRLYPVNAFLESTSYVPAVKAACRFVGLETGPVRKPLLELASDEHATLRGLLTAAEIGSPELVGAGAG